MNMIRYCLRFLTILYIGISSPILLWSQETESAPSIYTFSELVNAINNCPDSIFRLENARIRFDPKTDQHFRITQDHTLNLWKFKKSTFKGGMIDINKHVRFNNVQAEENPVVSLGRDVGDFGALRNLHFKKSLRVANSSSFLLINCIVDGRLDVVKTEVTENDVKDGNIFLLWSNQLLGGCTVGFWLPQSEVSRVQEKVLSIRHNTIHYGPNSPTAVPSSRLVVDQANYLEFTDIVGNTIRAAEWCNMFISGSNIEISENKCSSPAFLMNITPHENCNSLIIDNNQFSGYAGLAIDHFNTNYEIDWKQFQNKLFSMSGFDRLYELRLNSKGKINPSMMRNFTEKEFTYEKYVNLFRHENFKAYNSERAQLGKMYDFYKSNFDKTTSNMIYVEMKDLETKRYEYLQQVKPSFNNYFQWRINQFLKYFSEYGTNPAKSIIFSLYVILCFALFYLLFPNSWDDQGKHRIMNRYSFFLNYMNRSEGMHELYMENQKEEVANYEKFHELISKTRKRVPSFFTSTAGILYSWAISKTSMTTKLLKKIDFLRGTWFELSGWKKFWKSSLLIVLFAFAFLYDLMIKMLNALMLSLNTFSTLGFGEIPIRGLPRYMAILQGFIGWFLLTIFSVSLISQLIE
ncbi:MAG: two pore domain potassium channel family protein [Bacteroidetes bacterium]|nr:MAG: two pore domain potassium channel family protein [Bacteroidota bacterium]